MTALTIVTLILRVLLAAVFAVAGAAKLADRTGTVKAVVEFGGPRRLAPAIAIGLPLIELLVAGLLLIPSTAAVGAAAALILLVLFTAVVGRSLVRGDAPECHCFGQLHSSPAGGRTLARNGVLAALAAVALVGSLSDDVASPVAWLTRLDAAELIAVAVSAAALAVLGMGTIAFVSLMRSYGAVLVRLDRIEATLADAGIEVDHSEDAPRIGLEPGTPAPWFLATTPAGSGLSRDDLLTAGLPLLLLFTSPDCGPCAALLPDAARWQREHAGELTVAFASDGSAEAVGAEAGEFELDHVLVDEGAELYASFNANGTPSAVLISPDGSIASWVASGREAIETLLEQALETPEGAEGLPVGTEAPEIELRSLDGDVVPVSALRGRDTVLLFWNPGCGFCRSMHEGLLAWEAAANGDTPQLVIVSSGDEEETRQDGFGSLVLLDDAFTAGSAFGADGTPMAVLVDAEGKVASDVVAGAEAVLALTNRRV